MRLGTGFEIIHECAAADPTLLMLSVHPSRRRDLETPDVLRTDPALAVSQYEDVYGNICSRLLAPPGRLTLSAPVVVRDRIGGPVSGAMDFSAWFEAYLGRRWRTFDPRSNKPRMARVLIARGRDAVDVRIANTSGPADLLSFEVTSHEASARTQLA